MINFTTDQLATLIAVLSEGTFEKAADALHITPSAVSQRIKTMEQAAGRVLVQRANPAVATEAGESVARYARQVDLLARDLAGEFSAGTEQPAAPFAVAVNADSLATWFMAALAQAYERFGLIFDVHRDDQEHTAAALRSGTVMAAVTATERPVQGCVSTPLGFMRYRAVATPGFASQWFPAGRLDALDRAPAVDFDRKDHLQQDFVRELAGRDHQGPRHLIPTSSDFARAVTAGLGWGMLPDAQCSAALRRGALVELAPGAAAQVYLYWQRWNLHSALLDGVTEIVLAAAAGEVAESVLSR
jgi:LysR family transcriptional regulator (chromosome initiation inhibitor)